MSKLLYIYHEAINYILDLYILLLMENVDYTTIMEVMQYIHSCYSLREGVATLQVNGVVIIPKLPMCEYLMVQHT